MGHTLDAAVVQHREALARWREQPDPELRAAVLEAAAELRRALALEAARALAAELRRARIALALAAGVKERRRSGIALERAATRSNRIDRARRSRRSDGEALGRVPNVVRRQARLPRRRTVRVRRARSPGRPADDDPHQLDDVTPRAPIGGAR